MEANTKTKFKTTDEYLSTLSKDKRDLMQTMRKTIQEAAPEAQEVISYNMPAFKLNKILVYYAARTNHIGLYPTASGIEMFKKELSDYEYSKGAVQFPVDKPLPLTLITKIVKFRAKENMEKAKVKMK